MILNSLENSHRAASMCAAFKKVFDYVASHDLLNTEVGKIILDKDNIWLNIAEEEGRNIDNAPLEAHKQYIDIQILLSGSETFGYSSVNELSTVSVEYDEEKDIMFYEGPGNSYFRIEPNNFVIFFPGDAHAPCISDSGKIKKVVAKIKTDLCPICRCH